MNTNELPSENTRPATTSRKRAPSASPPEPKAMSRRGLARFYLDAELEYMRWRPRPRLVFPPTPFVM